MLAASQARFIWAADGDSAVVETSAGKVRGTVVGDIKVFQRHPLRLMGNTTGKNRFMPPTKPVAWTGTRDALVFGPTAPQGATGVARAGAPVENEDCLVLNVFTPSLTNGARRPVMVWLHGGGFATGSGSTPILDGTSPAHSGDVVVVTINHRLNVLGFTYLGEQAGPDFALSGGVGMLDIVAALEWVRDNISRFGGDPNLVTIFGQSGGGRKVATLMSMPVAQGLYHRAIIESGAVLRLTTKEEAIRYSELLLAELGLKSNQARDLSERSCRKSCSPLMRKLEKKLPAGEPGMVANSPTVDGKAIPSHPWDPKGPVISARIPLLIGWAHTEETLYDRPTPESLALDEAGLRKKAAARLEMNDPGPVIEAFRKGESGRLRRGILYSGLRPGSSARHLFARTGAKRKADWAAALAYLYRFDWETPEGGGHMRSPHTIEIQFVFNNIKIAGLLISKMPEAYTLAEKVSASWVAFARTGNPNVAQLPKWPAYSAGSRDTMIFNNESRVVGDPDRGPRLMMEKVLKLA